MTPVARRNRAPVHAEDDVAKVVDAVLQTSPATKQARYFTGVIVKDGRAPRSIKVEDVTDDQPVTFVEDAQPRLEGREWKCSSDLFSPDKDAVAWLLQDEDTIRIYRFTIVTAEGRADVLYEAHSYPMAEKASMRQQLGLELPSAN